MVITKLIGGLGNQMFQYAAGRRAAFVNNTELKLDITGYEKQKGITPREYQLSVFNIYEQFASEVEIIRLKKPYLEIITTFLPSASRSINSIFRKSYKKQKSLTFDPSILKVSDNTYLDGYWGSEKYFKDIAGIIRKEFTFLKKPDKENLKIIREIQNSNSVSIHIRRGDYISLKPAKDLLGTLPLHYYRNSIDYMTNRIRKPHFFIFSDDPEWCRENLILKLPTTYIINNYKKQDHEDMRLMSLCKNNIIANSSFSWWGAWLNQNPEKIVVAPKKWFRDRSIDTRDIIPESWFRL